MPLLGTTLQLNYMFSFSFLWWGGERGAVRAFFAVSFVHFAAVRASHSPDATAFKVRLMQSRRTVSNA